MPAYVGLWCVAALLGIAAAGVVAGSRSWGSNLVYGASLLGSLMGLVAALWHLLMGPGPEGLEGVAVWRGCLCRQRGRGRTELKMKN